MKLLNVAPKCPEFDTCSVNKCPLDYLYPNRVTDNADPEKKCYLSKVEIQKIKDAWKPLSHEQHKKIVILIKKECCNCDSGNCMLLDDGEYHKCPQLTDDFITCDWFKEAVLPLDPILEMSIFQPKELVKKACAGCGKSFTPISGKVKYCSEICAKKAHRKQMTRSMQNIRSA